jgi:hypothetical protein
MRRRFSEDPVRFKFLITATQGLAPIISLGIFVFLLGRVETIKDIRRFHAKPIAFLLRTSRQCV